MTRLRFYSQVSVGTSLVLLMLLFACRQAGWDDPRPRADDDDSIGDDDDSAGDDDDSAADDDDSGTDDDDSAGDDDDSAGDDDDSAGDDDDSTGDDDDSTPVPGDGDGDGFAAEAAGGDDCDDTDPNVHPGATEDPTNGIDDDCDAEDDEEIELTALSRQDGLALGGTLVTVTGSGFTGVTSGSVGGTSVTSLSVEDDTTVEIETPPGTVTGTAVSVALSHAFDDGELPDAFLYTGTSSDLGEGQVDAAQGVSNAQPGVAAGPFCGTVTELDSTTGHNTNAGSTATAIVAEVGMGPQGWEPTRAPDSWSWVPATFAGDDGDGDSYCGSIAPPTYGGWLVTLRFSSDDGVNWLYADEDPSTDEDSGTPEHDPSALEMPEVVVPPPVGDDDDSAL